MRASAGLAYSSSGWPENSWEVSECHIPYQAAYLRLLAGFAHRPCDLDEDGESARFIVYKLDPRYPEPVRTGDRW